MICFRPFLLAALLTAILSYSARACALAVNPDFSARMIEESAVIVWNDATHTEQFIRRAAIDTTANDVGFLVPTPAPPTVKRVSVDVFYPLALAAAPRTEYRDKHGFRLTSFFERQIMTASASGSGVALGAGSPIEILSATTVAGYAVTVLRADDAAALSRWLSSHGYATPPDLIAWLKPYIENHWTLTAFRFAGDRAARQTLLTDAIALTFQTDRPLYPYREPESARAATMKPRPPRKLRVYFVSDRKYEGSLADNSSWPGQITFANPLAQNIGDSLRRRSDELDSVLERPAVWLTAFDDPSSPRPGTAEVYFHPAVSPAPIIPATIILEGRDQRIPIPIETLALFATATATAMTILLIRGLRIPAKKKRGQVQFLPQPMGKE